MAFIMAALEEINNLVFDGGKLYDPASKEKLAGEPFDDQMVLEFSPIGSRMSARPGLSLVHWAGLRSRSATSLNILLEQLPEVAKVNRTAREYVEQVERENVIVEPASTPDPSASVAESNPDAVSQRVSFWTQQKPAHYWLNCIFQHFSACVTPTRKRGKRLR